MNQDKHYLVEDEWTLQAALAGPICQQVALHLFQAGQQRATGTAHRKTQSQAEDTRKVQTLQRKKTKGCQYFGYSQFKSESWGHN